MLYPRRAGRGRCCISRVLLNTGLARIIGRMLYEARCIGLMRRML
jgi:hypothetical protein